MLLSAGGQNPVGVANIIFTPGVSKDIGSNDLNKSQLAALGTAINNGVLLALDNDAKTLANYDVGLGEPNSNVNAVTNSITGGTTLYVGSPGSNPIFYTGSQWANFRNVLDGGDFTVNPWQRNISAFATGGVITNPVAATVTYFADRFFAVGGASSQIQMSQIQDTSIPGFSQNLKFQRQLNNSNTAAIYLGQVVESLDSVKLQGQIVTLSFWAKAGANFSGSGLNVQLVASTGNNQSAATLQAGTWAAASNVINTNQALTTSMVRYQFTGTVPANTTQVGMLLNYVPSGTAGADDSIYFQGFQLEIALAAGPFEHRDIQVELEICQRYAWITAEPASAVIVGAGMNTGASAQVFYIATPVQFIKAPTVTVGLGSFKTNQLGSATSITTLTPGTTHTVNAISVNANSAGTAGQATLLQGGGGAGYISASADF